MGSLRVCDQQKTDCLRVRMTGSVRSNANTFLFCPLLDVLFSCCRFIYGSNVHSQWPRTLRPRPPHPSPPSGQVQAPLALPDRQNRAHHHHSTPTLPAGMACAFKRSGFVFVTEPMTSPAPEPWACEGNCVLCCV